MKENKINETEIKTETVEVVVGDGEETVAVRAEEKPKKKIKFNRKSDKIKNQALLKKGSYSVAITAIVLAGIIVLNILVGALSKRINLEYDFSADKKNSLSEENIKYVKNVKKDVNIIFCTDEDSYSDYMSYYSQQYNVSEDATEYYDQTVKIVNKYAAYNGKINVKYVDPQSTEFTQVASDYADDNLAYGDIIVTAENNNATRKKVIKFTDIYSLEEDETYASYGVTSATVNGNNIENALTGAISYVLSDKTKKIAVLTGHSSSDLTADYQTLLSDNNYEIEVISDKMINSISDEFDGVVIATPTTDFLADEIKALNDFLDNEGKLGKGIVLFADASCPYLSNLYDFLEDWGISAEEGVVLETNDQNYMPDEPTTVGSYSTGNDDMTADMKLCISGNNVPLTAAFDSREALTVTSLMATPETAIAAPKGSGADFADADSYEQKSYSMAIMSDKLDYLDGTDEAHSYVAAFSSSYFIASYYNESSSVANKNLTLAVTERICGGDSSDISFVTKSIENESFAESVTQGSSNLIIIIFMILLPLAMIVSGIVVFIKRRNA